MLKKTTLIAVTITALLTGFVFSQDYPQDTAAVRAILDSADLTTTGVAQVTDSANGRITALRLGLKGMSSLPSEIGVLTELLTLSLEVNNLSTLPAEIGNLTKLTELLLYTNSLTALPSAIGSLTKLEVLWVSGNSLTALPTEIGNCTALKRLIVNRNSIYSLPGSIVNCQPTQQCDFGYNNLDANALATAVKDWLDEYDADWSSTQTVPVITSPQHPDRGHLDIVLYSTDNSRIAFSLPAAGTAQLDMLDTRGRTVATLVKAYKQAGVHFANRQYPHQGAGTYYLRLTNGNNSVVEKIVVTK